MAVDRVTVVERALDEYLSAAATAARRLAADAPLRPGSGLSAARAVHLWEDQATSRAIDLEARRLKASGRSFYTISGAGHEQNAVVGAQLRTTDPAFLHYRSGGFMMARARQDAGAAGQDAGHDAGHRAGQDPVLDAMLSVCARKDDPIAQGRHKVWGSRRLQVPPQTSTIASHLPKAVGMAFALGRVRRLGLACELPEDALVVCSFGDASANHATALSGFNAARYGVRRGNPVPILFLCEDNGIGISVDTPPRWIAESFGGTRYLRYVEADGEVDEVWDVV